MRLEDKVVLVTGASKGIGRAIAVGAAAARADVAVAYHGDEQGAESTAAAIREHGRQALVHRADLTRVPEIGALVEATCGHFGRVDVLINNAAAVGWSPALDVTEEIWDTVIDTNLKGSFFCAVECAKRMRATGGGSIVNLSSNVAALGVENLSCYAASKGGIHAWTRQLAVELAPLGIRVNTLAPGPTLVERNLADEPDYGAVWGEVVPLGRAADPEEMVGPAVFLASDDAAYVTGQLLFADGGWSIAGRMPGGHLNDVARRRTAGADEDHT
jgi:NAD(P)-dependent dehydrogenase (short-subunit alcohol dehydrogenase family)